MKMIKIKRSFAYKFFPSQYNSRDFYCEREEECTPAEAEEVSKALHNFCKVEVFRSVEQYKSEMRQQELKQATEKQHKYENKDKGKYDAEDDLNDLPEGINDL